MIFSEEPTIPNGYKALKTLFKNERNEIILAGRILDESRVVIKQSKLNSGNIAEVSKLAHEFDILKTLDHLGVPKVYELLSVGGTIALVQEYLEGTDLRKLIFKGPISYSEVLNIAVQLAEVLDYIHRAGVVHKDINSSNLILSKDGNLKLLDFGISSNLNSETSELLNVDQIEGTLAYISPEQTGRTAYAVTHQCDFYSFGILMYELLAGKLPFDSIDPLEIIHFHLSRNPASLSSIIPDLPKGLEQIISKLIEKNPDDRYQSAAGLKADLELVQSHFNTKKSLINFKAGASDVAGNYKQNQKLYGREQEIGELLEYYQNLNEMNSMLILVAGYSGVGKSAMIRHVKFPIIQSRGMFISGKFDQFKKDIPYYAFIEAIHEFLKNLLTEPADKIDFWKQRISAALGDNAGLITEVIPLLAKIIQNQPEVPKLQPAEQEARFHMVLLDFIYIFSTAQNPLVLFVDDLQWADLPSLNLIRRILENPRQEKVMILGAYRDNEVEKGHPLLITLKQIDDSARRVKTIHLSPLSLETTCRITADSFGMTKDQSDKLGNLVYSKTNGNPFFIHSFLKSLFDNKLVQKDKQLNWVWNQHDIDILGYTDNVIDLMTQGLSNLPLNTREVLKYAAALGNTFNLSDLADITEKSNSTAFSELKPAIQGGYLISNDNGYRTVALSLIGIYSQFDGQLSTPITEFTFTHDKVQQAAYNLIAIPELAGVHLRIGRLLLQNRDEIQLQEDIFEVLNHFAISSHLIETAREKRRITELCLIAGRKAKESTSYNLGVRFLEIARSLLGDDCWNANYELTYQVLIELGECEYLNDNPDRAETWFKEVLGYSKTNFEKLKVYYIHSSLYLKIGNTSESLRIGLEAVRLYNIRFPKNKRTIELVTLFTLAKYLVLFSTRYRNPESLFNLKECSDEEIIALNKFLIDLATSAYQQDQNLMMLVIFKLIQLYIRKGFTDASGWGFSGFSVVVLSALKLQKRGYNLWEITTRLHQRTLSPLIKWRLSYTVLCFYNPWKIPFREGYESILETIKACVLNGDQIFTGYTVALYLRLRIAAGDNLNTILDQSEDHLSLIRNGKGGLDFFQCFYQLAKALSGQTREGTWDDNSFNDAETLERLNQEGNKTKLAFYHSAKICHLYFLGQYEQALAESRIIKQFADNMVGDLQEFSQTFYTALSISGGYQSLNPAEKIKAKKQFKKHLHDLKIWSDACPENYSQHYYLLLAEWNTLTDDFEEALQNYEKSMQRAEVNGFRYVVALANERAGIFSNRKQFTKQAQIYFQAAYEAYRLWGAEFKCSQLENLYPDFLKNNAVQAVSPVSTEAGGTSRSSKTALDLASVLKASQSIASQVKYDDLLKNLLHILLENAGATRGCLLLRKGNHLCLEAISLSGTDRIEVISSVPYDQTDRLPLSVINYCWRSDEIVALDDALTEEGFCLDPYIQKNQLHSVLCLPVTTQGKISGIIYLENGLLTGVFNKNRIEILQMLSGQIGISIENSILYENLEEKVLERTKEIEKALAELKAAQSQLIHAEKMASLGELTAGIAHEIQNPLNFVNNFSEVSQELLGEMKAEMDLGNNEVALEIAADVFQNLERINQHGKRAASIVKGMLQHSRSSNGVKELTDINVLAAECLQLAFHGLRAKDKSFNSKLITDFDPSVGELKVVSQDIGRVILNLLTNAFYVVNEKVKQQLVDYEPTVSVSTKNSDDKVEIQIADNGSGIPRHVLDKIFQPFFTTKPTGQGTGLGLSMAYDIVKAHGGELKVETVEGEGTTFIIQLLA